MKEFQEPTLELVTFEGDIITASECNPDCGGVCFGYCLQISCKVYEDDFGNKR